MQQAKRVQTCEPTKRHSSGWVGWDEIAFVAKPKVRPLTWSILDAQTSQNLVVPTSHGIDRIKSELHTLTTYLLDYPITLPLLEASQPTTLFVSVDVCLFVS